MVPEKRELGLFICVLVISLLLTQTAHRRLHDTDVFSETTQIAIVFTITDPVDGATDYPMVVDVAPNGEAVARLDLTSLAQTNAEDTRICDECSLTYVAGDCLSGDCASYDMAATNANMDIQSSVSGDPHMVGLLGQKIDWVGEDGGWYCLVSDGEGFQLNVRVTVPMPEEFPARQLISGINLLLPNGHSLLVEVKDSYSIETDRCIADYNSPCLADGALRILVDNEEAPDLLIPTEKVVLPEGVHFFATNLPAECRPLGEDRIWAAQFEKMVAARRSLSEISSPLYEWVLEPDTLAAPTWCEKYLEGGVSDLLATQSNHATLGIQTPAVNLRINIGVNHQDSVVDADGRTMVPELEFWQTDIGLERHHFPHSVGGMLGDTSRFVFDSDGHPIREGLNALHGPVESYRVTDALGVDFEQLHHKRFGWRSREVVPVMGAKCRSVLGFAAEHIGKICATPATVDRIRPSGVVGSSPPRFRFLLKPSMSVPSGCANCINCEKRKETETREGRLDRELERGQNCSQEAENVDLGKVKFSLEEINPCL